MKSKKYWWLNEESQQVLNRVYLLKGETVQDAVERIVTKASSYHNGQFKEEFRELIERGYMSLSSPIWSNCGTQRGLPISCFNVHVPDDMQGITTKLGEVIMQTKIGGGTSGYFGDLRGRGASITDNGSSSGSVSFMELFNTTMNVVAQGSVRRGAFAAYLDIDHPDIMEFLRIRDIGHPIQNLYFGVCVPDYWMQEMIDGHTDKRKIWAKVLESRQEKGMPYIFYSDNVNKNKPQIYKELDSRINASNLCSEIALPSNEDESFVCCLASMNLELYDEWKDTDAVKLAVYFLDGVMQEFIDKTKGKFGLKQAYAFAQKHRALGLGVLGWHSYLQRNMLPFDSMEAKFKTTEIFKHIQDESLNASLELSEKLGCAPIFNEVEGLTKYRNTTTMAIAPTTSSSAILGQVSAGIEPFASNYYKAGLAKGNFMRKNKYLDVLLTEKGINNEDTWRKIMLDGGSVQGLNELTQEEKDVFKTFKEISQKEIIIQASIRQKFIDQSQSLNLNIPPSVPIKDVNALLIEAWQLGVKTLYYQRSESVAKTMATNLVTCSSCES